MREHCVISCTLPSVPRSPSPDLVAGYHFNTPPIGLHSPASTRAWPACVLIWPSHLRSYTFCYTFLYVPGGHLIFLFMATLASCGDPETRLHVGSVSAPGLMWPSLLRSYTFRYTFLYVPGGLFTSPASGNSSDACLMRSKGPIRFCHVPIH